MMRSACGPRIVLYGRRTWHGRTSTLRHAGHTVSSDPQDAGIIATVYTTADEIGNWRNCSLTVVRLLAPTDARRKSSLG